MSLKMSDMMPVRKTEIEIGKPLPWAVYDPDRNLLLNKGVMVTSMHQLEVLTEKGLFRDRHERPPVSAAARDRLLQDRDEQPEKEAPDQTMSLDEIKLMPGDALQLQSMLEGQNERYTVRMVGMMKSKSLLVTAPMIDGKLIFVRDRQPFLVRAFSGLNVCAFKSTVLKTQHVPFPYMHLSWPDSVRAMRVRKAARAPVNVIAAVHDAGGEKSLGACRIIDLSVGGARLHAASALGKAGDRVQLSFKVKIDEIEEYLQVQAIIRGIADEEAEDKKPVKAMGLQFDELSSQQKLVIMNLVYQNMLKESA